MIVVLGDIHTRWQRVQELDAQLDPGVPVVQVGDFGWWPDVEPFWQALGPKLDRPVYWIDGNHEYFPHIPLNATQPVEVAPNLHYVPRGTVLELDGLRLGCLGGGSSVDYLLRHRYVDWFTEEEIRPRDIARTAAWERADIDVLVTHAAPQSVVQAHFPSANLPGWGLPTTWRSKSADVVEALWRRLGEPPLVCGHMHRALQHDTVRILDIDEALDLVAWLRLRVAGSCF